MNIQQPSTSNWHQCRFHEGTGQRFQLTGNERQRREQRAAREAWTHGRPVFGSDRKEPGGLEPDHPSDGIIGRFC